MSKVTLALGSFALGACVSFLGSHTSIITHWEFPVSAQTTPSVPPKAPSPALLIVGAEPTVPQIGLRITGGEFKGPIQPLDGLNCARCSIEAPVLTYAGGQFNCVECKIRSQRVEFKGAALNTFNLLKTLGAFGTPKQTPYIDPNAPRVLIAADKRAQAITLVSLEK
jgi:hypothetical protein